MAKKKPWVIEYPDLETIDLSDPELQKDLIRKGMAVGVVGGPIVFTQAVDLVAGGAKS